jgi:hypothetical protein
MDGERNEPRTESSSWRGDKETGNWPKKQAYSNSCSEVEIVDQNGKSRAWEMQMAYSVDGHACG